MLVTTSEHTKSASFLPSFLPHFHFVSRSSATRRRITYSVDKVSLRTLTTEFCKKNWRIWDTYVYYYYYYCVCFL